MSGCVELGWAMDMYGCLLGLYGRSSGISHTNGCWSKLDGNFPANMVFPLFVRAPVPVYL